MLHIIQQSSLEKIKPGCREFKPNYESASVLAGEEFAYQIVLYTDSDQPEEFSFKGGLGLRPEFYLVKQVPVTWPHYSNDPHNDYLLDEPGLLPDCLVPLGDRRTITVSKIATVLWVVVRPLGACDFDLDLCFYNDRESYTTHFYLHIIYARMPKYWFTIGEYIDPWTIADAHNVPMYSSEHWDLLKKYFEVAAKNGVTDLITPVFTPDFDEPNKNPIVQLVRFTSDKPNIYDFTINYDLLDCWVSLAMSAGIEAITIPPLFPSLKTLRCLYVETKRGYKNVPLFDENQTIFSHEYTQFVLKFSRSLLRHLKKIKNNLRITFQLTNDVSRETIYNYQRCRDIIQGAIKTVRLMDLNVDIEYHKLGISVSNVIPFKNMEPFISVDNDRLIASFDIYSPDDIINPLIAAPSLRLRCIGALCYRYDIIGLHNRGFNSCNGRLDRNRLNPYLDNDGELSYPSGSRSWIYPGRDGPLESVRLKQLYYALQDMAVFDFAERFTTRRQMTMMVDKELGISFKKYPDDPERLFALRNRAIALIEERVKKPKFSRYK